MVASKALSIGFLGAGQMATALAKGWLGAGWLEPASSRGSDPWPEARTRFASATGLPVTPRNQEVVSSCNVLVLAVKPQMMPQLISDIRSQVTADHLIISIAAGITLKTLSEGLGCERIVRVMPNTPCLVGASASGYAAAPGATPEDVSLVGNLFNAIGKAFALPEHLLDAVTGLSGSGPAFVYVMIEAMSDGGVRMGLPRDVATVLAAQTLLGAAKMVLETGQHPGVLKDAVASPGGTTIAGLHALEQGAFRGAIMNAIEAATLRSQELGRK